MDMQIYTQRIVNFLDKDAPQETRSFDKWTVDIINTLHAHLCTWRLRLKFKKSL